MTDKAFVLDDNIFADECVTRDLTSIADARILLDLYESTDPAVVSDTAPIEIHKCIDSDVTSEFDVWCNHDEVAFAHNVMRPPCALILFCAASRILTTRGPSSALVKGFSPWRMQSTKCSIITLSGSVWPIWGDQTSPDRHSISNPRRFSGSRVRTSMPRS